MPILAAETDMSVEANTVERSSMEASDIFRVKGYVVLPGMIDPALADFLWSYVHTKFASMLLTSQDRQVPHTPAAYGDPAFDGLLEYLRPQIEQRSSVALYPTYSYFRLYKRGDVLKRPRPPGLRNQHQLESRTNAGRPLADLRRKGRRTLQSAAFPGRRPALPGHRLLPLARGVCRHPAGPGVPALCGSERTSRQPEIRRTPIADAAETARCRRR